jgi:hypothetical protein
LSFVITHLHLKKPHNNTVKQKYRAKNEKGKLLKSH